MGNARQRDRRGGIKAWNSVKRDIVRHLYEDCNCIVTTMVDYYALPQSNGKAWPGRAKAGLLPFAKKASTVEKMLLDDVADKMGKDFDSRRFVPFIVMHEFEGLLFSDCELFARGVGREALAASLQAICDQFSSPEEINDSPQTAPSKRVQTLIPGYEKPFLGNLAALEIGLDKIRTACPHFQDWLTQLEQLSNFF